MEHGFALALLLSLVAAQSGNGQQIVAGLSARLGRSPAMLLAALGAALIASMAASHAGAFVHGVLPSAVRGPVAMAALIAAGIILLLPLRCDPLIEPTRSLGAIGLALLLRQSIDAPRLCLLALAILLGTPWAIAMGGALGSGLALSMGWAVPRWFMKQTLK